MKKKGGQILRVGKEKVTLIFDGMLFPIGCANIPHNKQPIEHVLKILFSKPGDRDRPPLYRKVGLLVITTNACAGNRPADYPVLRYLGQTCTDVIHK